MLDPLHNWCGYRRRLSGHVKYVTRLHQVWRPFHENYLIEFLVKAIKDARLWQISITFTKKY